MNNQFWIDKWKEQNLGFNQEEVNNDLIEFFSKFDLKNHKRVLVPLCGKSIDMIWLKNQGCEVTGIELSTIAAEAFFKENNLKYTKKDIKNGLVEIFVGQNIKIICGDFFSLYKSDLGDFEGIYDRAAYVALDKMARKKYANHLISLMDTKTKILSITFSYDDEFVKGPPFSIKKEEILEHFGHHCNVDFVKEENIQEQIPNNLKNKGIKNLNQRVMVVKRKL